MRSCYFPAHDRLMVSHPTENKTQGTQTSLSDRPPLLLLFLLLTPWHTHQLPDPQCAKCASAPGHLHLLLPVQNLSPRHVHTSLLHPILVSAQSCHFSEAFPPRCNTLHHLTSFAYFPCPLWKVRHIRTGTLLFCWLHK